MKPNQTPRVVIVGAGFAGSLTAAQLLRKASEPFDVCLIERHPPFGVGTAFNTSLPCHLLNVPAIRMSAYPDDPEHLLRWLASRGASKGADADRISGEAFLQRRLYGEYVEHTLNEAAQGSRARLTRVIGEAVAIEPDAAGSKPKIRLRDGSTIEASFAVLAIGNPPPSDPFRDGGLRESGRYAADPWDEKALDGLSPGDTVLTIGSNLTMVDVALTLDYRKHRGPIVAVSTHGLLPQPHRSSLLPAWASRIDGSPGGPRDLVRAMREEVRLASDGGTEWRPVVDSLRSRTGSIWASWSEEERRRFLRHARPYWEIHRHRMAPENAKAIQALLDEGRLRVVAGRITGVKEGKEAIEVRITGRRASRGETVRAARVVNCTGPGMDMRSSRDALVRDLLARGLARPGPLGLGFDADRNGALIGSGDRPSPALFTLGPPLKGRYWETTAVPEIRVQAEALALRLVPGAHGSNA